ncbi:MAG: SpoIIE family protein phosphatase [Chitinivibrionales bacterium]|nr:SpoIIE family protein phosphatase [Chitinivibrionales bacterium]
MIAPVVVFVIVLLVLLFTLFFVYGRFPFHAIYRSKAHLEQAFDSFDDPEAVIDRNYTIRRANRAYASLVGKPYATIVGSCCHKLLRDRDTPCEDCLMPQTVDKHKRHMVERSPHPANPQDATISLTFFPFESPRGVPAVLEHIRDTTELEDLRVRLERKNALLQQTAEELRQAQAAIYTEIDLAREVQESILPKSMPQVEGLRIDVSYQPIETVGGDMYDFVPFSSKRLGIFIGDASGHGLPAAFVSTMAKMSLYHRTRQELEPGRLMQLVNEDIINNVQTNHYLTCFWSIFDNTKRELWFTRAGHPKPIVVRADGEVLELDAPGTLVGMLDNVQFNENTFRCRTGDRIFLFTDGVYMSTMADGVQRPALTSASLQELLRSCTSQPFGQVIPTISQELSKYDREDDYTILVLEVE